MHHLLTPRDGKADQSQHVQTMWKAILKAPGFGTSFRQFWGDRKVRPVGVPHTLPDQVPCLPDVNFIWEACTLEYSAFEKSLLSQRRTKARETRLANPMRICRDLAHPQALPVQTLLDSSPMEVEHVSDDQQIITLTDSPQLSGQLVWYRHQMTPACTHC